MRGVEESKQGLVYLGTGKVGICLGGEIGECAQSVGADEEVVLHEDEVPRQPRRRPHQRNNSTRLPTHLQAGRVNFRAVLQL